ncbi:transketolase [Rhodococcus sp. G-MC3]|uniref:transketolase family protein n=1 Tax=Rhodococcus sp. G-MC3 TaxID=3046209 RepID=UPI0024B932C9|nr:transketolase [Rhodococcus sp. G-MC3]MDJ0393685.1 transketolase [Rhodococcus sp. G-MC3]
MTAVATKTTDQRERFYRLVPQLLRENSNVALVLAEIGAGYLGPDIGADVRDRVINVGIREQLLVSLAGGLALAGMRPIVHTFAPFLLERPFEQVKLDFGHQGIGGILVSSGGSYSMAAAGETHFGARDVALLDTLDGWTVHVPGHADEAEEALRSAIATDDLVYIRLDGKSNQRRYSKSAEFTVLRTGSSGTVVAVGPMADAVLAATEGRDLTVLYAETIRPFDARTLRSTLTAPDIAIVEPYLAGTSVPRVAEALSDVRHRVIGLGVARRESRKYGSPGNHDRAHGLDIQGIGASLDAFFDRRR